MYVLNRILSLLWEKNISEIDFCKAIGINKSAVTDWKKGKTKSYFKHIDKISDFLNVSTDYLLGKDRKIPKDKLWEIINNSSNSRNYLLYIGEQLLINISKEELISYLKEPQNLDLDEQTIKHYESFIDILIKQHELEQSQKDNKQDE